MYRNCLLTLLVLAALARTASAQFPVPPSPEDQTVLSATAVLQEIMAIPAKQIPHSMLADAQGVAIIPNVVKIGFVAGIRHGEGVVLVRNDEGHWTAPTFVSITGGSVGWQAGVQATDVVLVFKTRKSVDGLLSGKFTIGADAAAAAGPVGRQAQAATDVKLQAEIYSYSRSRGLFAGVSLDGSVLKIDQGAAARYYQQPGLPQGQVPPSCIKLMETLAAYTTPAAAAVVGTPGQPTPAEPQPARENAPASEAVRQQVVEASARLQTLLDDRWKQYLALPAEMYTPGAQVDPRALAESLSHYETIARTPAYRALSQRSEFQATLDLLRSYQALAAEPTLDLPPPPPARGAPLR